MSEDLETEATAFEGFAAAPRRAPTLLSIVPGFETLRFPSFPSDIINRGKSFAPLYTSGSSTLEFMRFGCES